MSEWETTNAGKVIFSTVTVRSNFVVDTYYGPILYDKLCLGSSRRIAIHRVDYMSVIVECLLKLGRKLELRTPSCRPICVLQATFHPARFINHPHFKTAEARRTTVKQLAEILSEFRIPNYHFNPKHVQRNGSLWRILNTLPTSLYIMLSILQPPKI